MLLIGEVQINANYVNNIFFIITNDNQYNEANNGKYNLRWNSQIRLFISKLVWLFKALKYTVPLLSKSAMMSALIVW